MCRVVSEAESMEQTPGSVSQSPAVAGAKPSTSKQQQQQPADIPEGLYDLLKGVTVAVLRDRPTDLYSFVADYFTKVSDSITRTMCIAHASAEMLRLMRHVQ